jgi:hypothetical protein
MTTKADKTRRTGLIGAELLKLRKRRGLAITTFALTVVPMVIAYVVLLILHATAPEKHGPAGGVENFTGSLEIYSLLAGVAAVLVAATLGAGDLGAGVFRELVVTGRSRWSLFAARVPGGLAFLLPFVLAGFAITATAATVFAGDGQQAPSTGLLLETGAWIGLIASVTFALALGVASLLGSRGTTIGILLAWQLAVAPLLLQISVLGGVREGLLTAAVQRLQPSGLGGETMLSMSMAAAVAVVAAWMVVPLAVGGWRTARRDA